MFEQLPIELLPKITEDSTVENLVRFSSTCRYLRGIFCNDDILKGKIIESICERLSCLGRTDYLPIQLSNTAPIEEKPISQQDHIKTCLNEFFTSSDFQLDEIKKIYQELKSLDEVELKNISLGFFKDATCTFIKKSIYTIASLHDNAPNLSEFLIKFCAFQNIDIDTKDFLHVSALAEYVIKDNVEGICFLLSHHSEPNHLSANSLYKCNQLLNEHLIEPNTVGVLAS